MSAVPQDPNPEKTRLRAKLKELRIQVTPVAVEAAGLAVWYTFHNLPEFKKSRTIGGFASVAGEINTLSILEGVLNFGKKLCLPKVTADKDRFDYIQVQDFKKLKPGAFGILEPGPGSPVPWEELDVILVPGLAFDRSGNRLGFGKGFYDRAIPKLRKNALTVGLAYSFQIVDKVPVTKEDIPIKALLSEKGFQYCGH